MQNNKNYYIITRKSTNDQPQNYANTWQQLTQGYQQFNYSITHALLNYQKQRQARNKIVNSQKINVNERNIHQLCIYLREIDNNGENVCNAILGL